MQARLPLRIWLAALFVAACVAGCSWKPRGDTLVLPDGSFGGIEVFARDPTTGRGAEVQVMAAPHVEEWREFHPHHRLVLHAGKRALTLRFLRDTLVETIINVIPDTFVQVVVDMPAAGHGSRLIPDEQCAIIKGTITAGRTGRRVRHADVEAPGTCRSTRSDSVGNYRIAVPGWHHRLSAGYGRRGWGIDTVVDPGDSAIIDMPVQLALRSRLLHDLLQAAPVPWSTPLRDATDADSDIVRAVEDWIEQTEPHIEDTLKARTFAAFELLGTSSRGRWVTAYGGVRQREWRVDDTPPYCGSIGASITCLLKVGGRWVAAEPWYDSWKTSPFDRAEDWFPARYEKRLWIHGRCQRESLESRVEAKVAEWERRLAESQTSKP